MALGRRRVGDALCGLPGLHRGLDRREALLLFHDASFQDLARLMNHQGSWITAPSWNC
jgi:hypothetical protein